MPFRQCIPWMEYKCQHFHGELAWSMLTLAFSWRLIASMKSDWSGPETRADFSFRCNNLTFGSLCRGKQLLKMQLHGLSCAKSGKDRLSPLSPESSPSRPQLALMRSWPLTPAWVLDYSVPNPPEISGHRKPNVTKWSSLFTILQFWSIVDS